MATNRYDEAMASVHALASAGKIGKALSRLFDDQTWRLNAPFRTDGNHSWYVAGDLLLRRGRYAEAAKAFRRSIQAWPDDSQAIGALGYCCSEMGKAWLAERHFRRSLEIDPGRREVRFNLGNALFDQRKFRSAIREYGKAIAGSDELSGMARRNRGLAERALKNGDLRPSGS